MPPEGFHVAVALEVDEDTPVADVHYRGSQVAAIRPLPSGCEVVLYDANGVPLDGLIAALTDAGEQLQSRSTH